MTASALVTGGTGFVGANLVRRLLHDGTDVHLLCRPEAAMWRIDDVRDRITVHRGQLGDGESVDRVIGAVAPQWIYHLAAYGAYSWQADLAPMARTNVLGTAEVLAAASRHACAGLVVAGSSAEYGPCPTPPDESARLSPTSQYGVTKAAASTMAVVHSRQPGSCPLVVLRLYSVYGPWEDPGRLVPTLLRQAIAGGWPPLADADTHRDFVYVEDVVEALVRACCQASRHHGQTYNVGSGHATTITELVVTIRDLLRVQVAPHFGRHPGRPWDASNSWVANPARIGAELDWRPAVPLSAGLSRFAAWLRARPAEIGPGRSRPTDGPGPATATGRGVVANG